tara:strand:+ start:404 stop:1177 length:774 start_codon:yes stop_codon:yes gene_type:complete
MRILRNLGKSANIFLQKIGRVTKFIILIFSNLFTPPTYGGEILKAFFHIGWMSLPVLGLTALFTGGALALQIYAGGSRFNAEQVVPAIVAIGMARELGPVLGGLIVAARVASSIAAEIGTMKVTEQVDALITLSTDPIKYLAVPRVLAATLSLPVLIAIGDSIGILGGYLVGINRLDFSSSTYLASTASMLQISDISSGLVKGAFFGLIISVSGCYCGFQSSNGAEGVGKATKSAVVAACVFILAANYILTEVFFNS